MDNKKVKIKSAVRSNIDKMGSKEKSYLLKYTDTGKPEKDMYLAPGALVIRAVAEGARAVQAGYSAAKNILYMKKNYGTKERATATRRARPSGRPERVRANIKASIEWESEKRKELAERKRVLNKDQAEWEAAQMKRYNEDFVE